MLKLKHKMEDVCNYKQAQPPVTEYQESYDVVTFRKYLLSSSGRELKRTPCGSGAPQRLLCSSCDFVHLPTKRFNSSASFFYVTVRSGGQRGYHRGVLLCGRGRAWPWATGRGSCTGRT